MKNLIFLLPFVLALSACNKYDDTAAFKHLTVPPYTETGANTFGCYVNGAAWANFGADYVKTELSLGSGRLVANKVHAGVYFNSLGMDTEFSVGARLSVLKHGNDIRDDFMSINIPKNGNLEGVYQLNNSNYQFMYTSYINETTYLDYVSFIGKPFTVTIKKDTIEVDKHIVSGIFSGTLYTRNRADSIRITGGVFDTVLTE